MIWSHFQLFETLSGKSKNNQERNNAQHPRREFPRKGGRGMINERKNNLELIKYSKGMQSVRESTQFKKLKWVVQPRKPGQPTKRWGHTTVVHDGRLLVFGGNHSGVTREGVYKVDCQTLEGDALSLTVQPQMRQSHSCTLYHDCLYIYGGCINQQLTSDLLQVKLTGPNPSWRKLEQKNPIPPRESHLAVLIQKKYMLVYGGSTPQENFLDEFWILDLQTVTWHQVKQINGKLQARIGATMTPFGNQILSFGGEWGDGEDSQYSNDISKLRFEGDLKNQTIPSLSISKLEVNGPRPNARTGHSSVDYKGKMLIIIGGQGLTSKKTSILYNDIWAFDLRTNNWSELVVENRTSFRPRANFTANIYKNTIYIFGGFVNLSNFRCTDQLITLTLSENKHSHRQQNQHRVSTHVQAPNGNVPHYCSQCKFQFLPQERQLPPPTEQRIPNNNFLVSSTQNIIHAARSIGSPFEGLGLVVHALSSLVPQQHKQIYIDLVSQKIARQNQQISQFFEKEYLRVNTKGLVLTKDELQRLVFSYKCEHNDEGFDLKNGLFRLGKEVLICQLFEDGMLHSYFLTGQGVFRSVLHLQTIVYELQRSEHKLLSQFLNHYNIKLDDIQPFNLRFYVASLSKEENKTSQLKVSRKDLICKKSQKNVSFKEFIKDYFLNQKKVTLRVNGENVPLISYENLLRNHSTQRQQEPTTKYFSKVHLVINQHEEIINPPSAFIKLFALGRRVGVYNKFPFISGFLELNDISSLNYPRTRCDSWQIRTALEEQIQSLLQQCRKRESEIPLSELQRQTMD